MKLFSVFRVSAILSNFVRYSTLILMNDHNTDIKIRPLGNVGFEEIAETFLAAFADYELKLDTEKLRSMLKRRGADMNLSFGAFDNGRLVSFIINGIGTYNGKATAYDTGTGTLAEYRGRRLTDSIFTHGVEHLRKAGIENYLLEVLKHNVPAIKIYTRQGFDVTREFHCYDADNTTVIERLKSGRNGQIRIVETPARDIAQYSSFMDFAPSWQNSMESIDRNPDAFAIVTAYDGAVPVGIGVEETAYGDLTLLAVDKPYRNKGIASRIVLELASLNQCDRLKMVNIDSSCLHLSSFLEHAGFGLTCSQYEMVKKI